MAEDNPTVKLQFAPGQPEGGKNSKTGEQLAPSPTLEINNGDYDRVFNASEQPFVCAPEEAVMLLRTGYFVVAEEGETQQTANSEQQSARQEESGTTFSGDVVETNTAQPARTRRASSNPKPSEPPL